MENKKKIQVKTDKAIKIQFTDIFNLTDIQRLQDLFSEATGVASIIIHPDGTPITNPSSFCRLCGDIIRKTEKGRANCSKSGAMLGCNNPSGPIVQQCLSACLWEAGACITVGGKHIANWLIGQVRNEEVDEQSMLQYADEIGADRAVFMKALAEVPVMSVVQFKKVSEMLYAFARELSEKAYTNLQLKMQIAEQEKAMGEVEYVRPDGTIRTALLNVIPLGKENLFGIAHDITERKQSEETLVKLKKAIFTSGEAIFLTDLEGVFTFVNPAFTSLYGFSSDEVVGKTTPRIFKSGVMDDSLYVGFWQTLLNGNEVRGELINKRKNGTLINIEGSATPIIDEEKKIIGFLGIQRNITERKLAEQALIIANKEIAFQIEEKEKRAAELIIAEESDRLKTAFLNNISHEIRTPFNNILGFLSLMQDDGLTASERDEFTGIINKSAYRLMNTINDIVEISQIQAGQMKLTASKTNISRLTDEIYDRFKTVAKSKGLEFIINNDLPDNIKCIYTDRIKLYAILSILIDNGIKFSETGAIEFSIKLKTVGEAGPVGALVEPIELAFSVKDTGIGIPEKKQSKIFERFVQADGSNTRKFEGSGLGLSIAKYYVEMLGGKIWVESEEGKGSIFYFTIPYYYYSEQNP